jgi:drug/metabolite transporter (DMT)-like permease
MAEIPLRIPSAAEQGNRFRGMALMTLSTLFLASMHSAIRHVSEGLHPFEITFFRVLLALVVLIPWFVKSGFGIFHTQRLGLLTVRAILNVAAMLLFFYALSITPLTLATALTFSSPVMATVLAVFIFGEVVRLRRWVAILVGFAGIYVVLRPGFEAVGLGALLTIMATFGWAGVIIAIKALGRTESSVTIAAYMSVMMAPMALVPALFVWQWPSAEQAAWLLFIGCVGGIGQLLMTQALKDADTAAVAPLDFFRLVWVAIIGYVAFAEVPDLFTWIGAAMIVSSGVYIAARERGVRKRNAPQ